jgi:hypothetical protein
MGAINRRVLFLGGTGVISSGSGLPHLLGIPLQSWHGLHPSVGSDPPPPPVRSILDRIGGGDGSVGGMLYGILKGWSAEQCMQFGWATGALAAASTTDYGAPADEDQVWSIW